LESPSRVIPEAAMAVRRLPVALSGGASSGVWRATATSVDCDNHCDNPNHFRTLRYALAHFRACGAPQRLLTPASEAEGRRFEFCLGHHLFLTQTRPDRSRGASSSNSRWRQGHHHEV